MLRLLEAKKKYIYAVFVIYWLILLAATSFPANHVPDVAVSDKFKHFFAYLGFAFLFNIVLTLQNKSRLLKTKSSFFTLIFTLLYGVVDEIHQYFIPGRSCEFLDWIADFAGAVTAVTIFIILFKKNLKISEEIR